MESMEEMIAFLEKIIEFIKELLATFGSASDADEGEGESEGEE